MMWPAYASSPDLFCLKEWQQTKPTHQNDSTEIGTELWTFSRMNQVSTTIARTDAYVIFLLKAFSLCCLHAIESMISDKTYIT